MIKMTFNCKNYKINDKYLILIIYKAIYIHTYVCTYYIHEYK